MKKICTVTFVILVAPLVLFAQRSFKPGYVVTLKGDTVRGTIGYKESEPDPSSIIFLKDATSNVSQTLTTNDISFFSADQSIMCQRYKGQISTDPIDAAHVSMGRDTSYEDATVFLKVLQKGSRFTIFTYIDAVKQRFFISDVANDSPRELEYRIYNTDDPNTNSVRTKEENTYRKQLFALAQKYNVLTDDLLADIQRARYSQDDLVKIVSTMNGISKEEFKQKYESKANFNFFVSAGLNISNISPYGSYETKGANSSTSYFPEISFGLDLSNHQTMDRVSFRVEGVISGNSYRSIYIATGSPYVPVKYSYNQIWFALTPQVIYNIYNKPNFKIFAGAGVAFTYHQYYNAKYDLDYAATQVKNGDLTSLNNFFKSFTYPLVFKAGARIGKKVEVFADYYTSSNVSNDPYFLVNYSNVQVGVNYFFK